jgi:hypothetical protein
VLGGLRDALLHDPEHLDLLVGRGRTDPSMSSSTARAPAAVMMST